MTETPAVDVEVQRRIAENEARFRAANQKIEDAAVRLDGGDGRYPFVCECGRRECLTQLRLTIAEYEHGRSNSRWFLNAPGHGITTGGIGEVVERHAGFEIVSKKGVAGDIAEATDPR